MTTGVKISELTAASTFTGAESFPLVQSSTTLKGTASQMTTYVAAATATLINKTLSGTFNTFTNIPLSSAVTGTLPVENGGTGVTTYAVGDLLYATATTTLAKLAATATTFVLLSGTAPSWGKVNVASAVTGTMAILNGGTGATTAVDAVVNLSAEYVVTTLAALKALTARPATVTNQYRSTIGDGGGGTWIWRSGDQSANVTADTESGVWAAPDTASTGASGAWQRQYGPDLYLEWFGAAGNGSTDDTTAVSAAIAWAAYTGTGTIRLRSGCTYVVDGVYAASGITIIGDNTDNGGLDGGQFTAQGSTGFKLKASSSTGKIFRVPVRTHARTTTGTVSVTNGSAAVTGSGTSFTSLPASSGAFYIAGVAYTVSSVTNDTSLTLTRVYAGTTGSGKAYSADTQTVTVLPVNSFTLERVVLDGNQDNNSSGVGIDFDTADPASIANQNQDDNITIRSCVIRGCKTAGIRHTPGHRAVRVTDSYVIDNDGDGIIAQGSDLSFQNNYVGNNGGHNYDISGSAAVAIIGGEIWQAGRGTTSTKHGVKISDSSFYVPAGGGAQPCSGIVIAPMFVDRNGGAGVDISGGCTTVRVLGVTFYENNGGVGTNGHINSSASVDLGVMVVGCGFDSAGSVSAAIYVTGGLVVEGSNQGTVSTNDRTKLYTSSKGILRVDGSPALNSDGSYTTVLEPGGAASIYVGGSGDPTNYYRRTTHKFQAIDGTDKLELGVSAVFGAGALATSATDGFVYIPACAGAPSGAPTAKTGRVPLVVDSTNNKLYFYSGGAWRDAGP